MGARIARRLLPGLAAVPLLPRRGRAATISLRAADGLSLTAEHLPAQGARRRGCILLFHMAGSNLGEYAPIAPELNRMGFETLALDQRSGGDGWGRRNETAARLGRDPGYRAALPDLEGALAWARGRDPSGRVLAWGSSYSAALVFPLAAMGGVSALLAFSPGEYLPGFSVRGAAARVNCPAFVASDRGEEGEAARLLDAVRGAPKRQFRPVAGAHGSSILRADRNPRGAAQAWAAVREFLDEVAG